VSCGKIRDTEHEWSGCKCAVCGSFRDRDHNWDDEKCRTCGRRLSADLIAKRWAEKLQATKDYHALAAYCCTYSSEDESSDLWSAKRVNALEVLSLGGRDAVDAMLAEMERGKDKDSRVADILVDIGDPKAVPLLKQLLDRDEWDSYSWTYKRTLKFINCYPQYQGEVEKVACATCGKVRPVTETKQCKDKRFCKDTCWSKRGGVLEHGIGTDCPFYAEGVCMAGGRDTGLCSLQTGSYVSSCHVYAMH